MSAIFGHLNISDSDRVFNSTVGQRVIWDAAQEYLGRVNAELAASLGLFVQETTENFKERYKLPGGGYLQQRNSDGSYQAVKVTGQWDVCYPIRDQGAQIAGNDVDMAYMTVKELDNHIQTVVIQNVNTTRYWVLKAILNNTEVSFVDPLHGTLACEPLANGDSVVYPPVIGATAEATEDHYLASNYAYTAISTTNNPILTMKADLEHHYGLSEGGSDIIIFVPASVTPYLVALGSTHWTDIGDPRINYGNATNLAQMLGASYPGTLRGRCDGCWIVEWAWMPTDPTPYLFGIYPGAPAPLKRRDRKSVV